MNYSENILVRTDRMAILLGQTEIHKRVYENNVFVSFGVKADRNIYIYDIEAKEEGKGHGTQVMKDFMNEFTDYEISLDAVEYAIDWYKSLGFEQTEPVTADGYAHMIFKKSA